MPRVPFPLKALARLSSRGQHGLELETFGLASWRRSLESGRKLERFSQTRSLRGVVRSGIPCIDRLVDADKEWCNSSRDSYTSTRTRWFLGCGDGEEGNVLSKTHEERRVVGYSPEQLFGVVAAVDLYEDFVPWCQRSRITRRNNDGSFDSELEIGFKFLVESYVSHVELDKPKSIKTTVSQSGLFEYLINIWEFNPGPVPGSCDLYFSVDFKFQSPLYRQVASMFFKEVVARMVDSFSNRCHRIYGPGIRVSESPYGQGI